MAEVLLSHTTQSLDPFRDAPRTIIYDPGKHIRNPVTQLHPFGSVIEIYHDVKDLVNQVENSQDKQVFLLLIFPTKNDIEVKRFLMKYIPNQGHLFSLYLIFPNGIQFHEQWKGDRTMPKLGWCRSFTNRLIRDILDVCKSACDQHITFYQQRQIAAEDDLERNSIDSSPSIVILFARKTKEYACLLSNYLTTFIESDD